MVGHLFDWGQVSENLLIGRSQVPFVVVHDEHASAGKLIRRRPLQYLVPEPAGATELILQPDIRCAGVCGAVR